MMENDKPVREALTVQLLEHKSGSQKRPRIRYPRQRIQIWGRNSASTFDLGPDSANESSFRQTSFAGITTMIYR
jgi:hypothetical protein